MDRSMTTQPKPEALRLAGALLEPVVLDKHAMQAADELLRLHAECETLRQANVAFAARQAWWNDRMVALEAECEALRADRDSWERQCSDRVDDAVEFLQQRDEARAECEALRMERDALRAAANNGGWMGYFDDAARAAKEQNNG